MIEIAGRRMALYASHPTETPPRSVSAQLVRCREHARQHGAMVVAEYADTAKPSAPLETRDKVMALLDLAEQGEFEVVLVEALSRVSSDQADIATVHKILDIYGVALISATEGPVSDIHTGLEGAMNALARKERSDNTRRGQLAAVRNGAVPGGRIYGYDVVRKIRPDGSVTTGQRRIDKAEAGVVLRIFTEAASGKPLQKIAAGLNRDGIPSAHGKRWTANTIVGTRARDAGLLRRPIYNGRIVFGRTRTARHPLTGKRIVRLRPETEWTIVEVPELAIIPENLFDLVQDIIDQPPPVEVKRPGRKPADPLRYLTSGRTWCASCGGRVTTAHSGYLICSTWKERRGCDQRRPFRRDRIVPAILRYFATPDCDEQMRSEIARQIELTARHASTTLEMIEEVDGLLRAAGEKITSLARETEEAPGFARVRERIGDCESGIADLHHRLARLRLVYSARPTALSPEMIAAAASARLATASKRLSTRRRHDAADGGLLDRVLASVHVAYTDPKSLDPTVRPRLDGKAAYEIGMIEIAVAARRTASQGVHRETP